MRQIKPVTTDKPKILDKISFLYGFLVALLISTIASVSASDTGKEVLVNFDRQLDLANYSFEKKEVEEVKYVSDFEYKERQQLIAELKVQMKAVFGSEWRIAYAVAEAECNSRRVEWPKCKLSWEKEHSIGWFQINIAQEEGYGKKVHWDKIPGQTLEQKEAWLNDPFNNIIMANVIKERSNGFTDWTAFTNGNYKAQLEVK